MKSNALWLRAKCIKAVREFFWSRGFLEVETPLLIPANAPEEYINPLIVSPTSQLQTSPELCMKRLLSEGHQKLFQICHCWRSHERGSRHLQEFTMLEWYRSNADYEALMTDCEELLRHVALSSLPEGATFRRNGHSITPFEPWQRITVQDAFERFSHGSVWECLEKGLYEEILTSAVEPGLATFHTPVFLLDYPAELAALSRLKAENPRLAERFELYVGGLELANGFSELTDPEEQRRRFIEANRQRSKNGEVALPIPEPFLTSLAAMPPSAGIALGIDRLIMLTAGTDSIDEVVAFTPEDL